MAAYLRKNYPYGTREVERYVGSGLPRCEEERTDNEPVREVVSLKNLTKLTIR
ncbi:MAG: hypothetical protein IPJ13_21830 [Saprospiraceae bacterium]|nr:hypothetical protein [Saprospiraceae bacterium]